MATMANLANPHRVKNSWGYISVPSAWLICVNPRGKIDYHKEMYEGIIRKVMAIL